MTTNDKAFIVAFTIGHFENEQNQVITFGKMDTYKTISQKKRRQMSQTCHQHELCENQIFMIIRKITQANLASLPVQGL